METRRNQGICLLIVQTMNCICHENEFCENNYATELIFGLFTRLCGCEYLDKICLVGKECWPWSVNLPKGKMSSRKC